MVGVPRFELGSKRPKRPSIGQTNPYARCVWPRLPYYQLHSRNCQIPSPALSIIPCASAISKNATTSSSKPLLAKFVFTISSVNFPSLSTDFLNTLSPFAEEKFELVSINCWSFGVVLSMIPF